MDQSFGEIPHQFLTPGYDYYVWCEKGRRCGRRKPRVDDASTVLVGADGVRPNIRPEE